MCKIKLLGPQSEKYNSLKNRILNLAHLMDDQFQLVEIKDVNHIVAENIDVVPTAIYHGEKMYHWTIDTSTEDMVTQLNQDRLNKEHACTCGAGCRMRKLNPEFRCK
jgi:hypothetical protein